jgi:sterol desaturase/sphingolipid hydroxylase (fatty acid hydroxylase superfamily)
MRPPCMKVRRRHVPDGPGPAKEHAAGISLNQPLGKGSGLPNNPSDNLIRAAVPVPRSNEMRSELHGRKFWHQAIRLMPTVTAAIYFGELFFATALAIVLLVISTSSPSIIIVRFYCGLVAWTLAEYITHRFVLHAIAPVQHGIHHARPRDAVDKIFWQIWLAFAVLYPILGGAVMAGVLVAYAWYLLVHYCAHHHSAVLPASVLKHHLDHHRFANRNYGVTTRFWDRVFGTMLR